jgi:hypothetical protein
MMVEIRKKIPDSGCEITRTSRDLTPIVAIMNVEEIAHKILEWTELLKKSNNYGCLSTRYWAFKSLETRTPSLS